MSDYKKEFEKLYETPGKAPWTFVEPHAEMRKLVKTKKITPCRALEIGCGEGYHAIFLAKAGFAVTAIDRSKRAIALAKQHAKEENVIIKFLNLDYKEIGKIKGTFDFVYDWRFLHEILHEAERKKYFQHVHRLLSDKGHYLSVAFSGESKLFGKGNIRIAPTGIELYFGKLGEVKKEMSKLFNSIEAKHIEVPEKPHTMIVSNYLLMVKK